MKKFKKLKDRIVEAVKGTSFDVKRGELFGFLGINGARKSTTISMLTTWIYLTEIWHCCSRFFQSNVSIDGGTSILATGIHSLNYGF